MVHRLTAWLFCLATAFIALTPTSTAAHDAQDSARIVAVGDLHGDFGAWQAIAQAADLIDGDGNWTGGETILVQMGDVTDRGPDSLKIIRSLQGLEAKAQASGGQVFVLMGNHEAMNVLGDLRYVHPGEYEAFKDRDSKRRRDLTWKANRERIEAAYATLDPPIDATEAKARWFAATPLGKLEHRRAWSPGGELAEWAARLPAVLRVGDTLFVHGGLSVEWAMEPLEAINERVRAALRPGDDVDRSAPEDPLGPLWYRGNVLQPASGSEGLSPGEKLEQVLAYHGASRLVVAHTPSLKGIASGSGGHLIRVDTGISAHYGGPYSYLEILGGRVVAHQRGPDGEWASHELNTQEERAAQ